MNKWYVISSGLQKKASRGFFLLELQLSLFLVMLLLTLLVSGMSLGWQSWSRISADAELRDAGRYILNRIEKDISVSSTAVRITGTAAKSCFDLQTVEGKHVIQIYCDKKRLYRKILNISGSGVNPLYINKILVEQWTIKALDSKSVLISFWLSYNNNNRQYFQRIVHCYNGVVVDYGV